jgi:hypothetical protein
MPKVAAFITHKNFSILYGDQEVLKFLLGLIQEVLFETEY